MLGNGETLTSRRSGRRHLVCLLRITCFASSYFICAFKSLLNEEFKAVVNKNALKTKKL